MTIKREKTTNFEIACSTVFYNEKNFRKFSALKVLLNENFEQKNSL